MKKLSFLLAVAVMLTLSACSSKNKGDSAVQYGSMSADWPSWDSTQSLIESEDADQVLIGKITGISFQITDKRTGHPPAEGALEKYAEEFGSNVEPGRVFELITIYDVHVLTTYKGEAADSTRIRMKGGRKDFREEEQWAMIQEYGMEFIPVYAENPPELEIDETYLCVLTQIEDCLPTPLNLHQSIYNLHNPFEKSDRPTAPDITAQKIISLFGQEKWDTFWTQWKAENPSWQTWIDTKTVEEALAKS